MYIFLNISRLAETLLDTLYFKYFCVYTLKGDIPIAVDIVYFFSNDSLSQVRIEFVHPEKPTELVKATKTLCFLTRRYILNVNESIDNPNENYSAFSDLSRSNFEPDPMTLRYE